jgi:DNA repair exonuclease SbcCD ATPase subunit
MTERATAAEKFLAEARERLLARIVEIDAVRQKAAAAKAESQEAHARHRQLEDALRLRQHEVEELERSRSSLEATRALMATFEERRRALRGAEEKIKHLAVRNALLEVGADIANRADGGTDTPIEVEHVGGGDPTTRRDWAELARLLSDLMERKRQSMGEHARSVTVLAGNVTF